MRSDRKPNIVFIICDDLSYGDLDCHGNPHTHTPNLDRLYQQSVRITRYCTGPLCSPARTAIMTGRHPYRTRAFDTYIGRSMADPDEVMIPQLLKDAGYATAISGKWHLGDVYPMRPMDKGFDEALYHRGGGICQLSDLDWPDGSYFDPLLVHNGQHTKNQGYCTDVFTDHALQVMEQHKDEPFYCYVAYNAPHAPFEVAEELAQSYRDQGLNDTYAKLYGMVENIDTNVGRIMQKLDDLGLTDVTILVFTSDHGPCPASRFEGKLRYNAGLRDMKGSLYEGGIRTPCLIRYPSGFKSGDDVDRIANPIDWLPTFAAVAGCDVPADRTLDGVDLTPLLSGETEQDAWPERNIVMQWHRGDVPDRGRNCAVITQQYKWLRHNSQHEDYDPGVSDELYDIEADPSETRDLAAEMPERCHEMRAIYDAWFDDVSSTRGATVEENFAPPRMVVGTDHENPSVLTQQDWRSLTGEGWSRIDHRGYWLIDNRNAGPYKLKVVSRPHEQAAKLTLTCGDVQVELTLKAGQTEITFDAVTLPLGHQRLEAHSEIDGQLFGIGQVWLER